MKDEGLSYRRFSFKIDDFFADDPGAFAFWIVLLRACAVVFFIVIHRFSYLLLPLASRLAILNVVLAMVFSF